MKRILFSAIIGLAALTACDSDKPVRFEDPKFKAYLVEHFDTDGDGEMSKEEMALITEISLHESGIESLDGIRYCTNLETLYFTMEPIKTLDVSGCSALTRLSCVGCQIADLNISGCTSLESIFCGYNNLTNLDINGCPSLKHISCMENALESLDANGCIALTHLDCENNCLTSLNLDGCTKLQYLSCFGNLLTGLDMKSCTALTHLKCSNNKLTTLDISGHPTLKELWCGDNKALRLLSCHSNRIESLDISNCVAMERNAGKIIFIDIINESDKSPRKSSDKSDKHYSLECSPMPTLKTLYLKSGWKIDGINVNRNTACIPAETEIRYKE